MNRKIMPFMLLINRSNNVLLYMFILPYGFRFNHWIRNTLFPILIYIWTLFIKYMFNMG